MNILEFTKETIGFDFYKTDACGNVYVYTKPLWQESRKIDSAIRWDFKHLISMVEETAAFFLPGLDPKTEGVICLTKEIMEELEQYQIIVDEDVNWFDYTRRPYYRMRGKSVTEEQAFDIIRKTDNYFEIFSNEVRAHSDYIGCMNFDNWLIGGYHSPRGYGWIHTDGTIGINTLTQKYPDVPEFIQEWMNRVMEFPYLDLIIAVTSYNETIWDEETDWFMEEFEEKNFEKADRLFYESIEVGIYMHDKKVEILNKKRAAEVYREYAARYEKSDRKVYAPEYYEEHNIVQVDEAYLKRCYESYGISMPKQAE